MFGRKRDDDDVYYGVISQDPRVRFFQHKNKKNRRGEPSRAKMIIDKYELGPEDMTIHKENMIGKEAGDWEQEHSSEPSRRGIKKDKPGYYGYNIGPSPEPSLTKRFVKWIFRMSK